jgi:hypothetical protein
MCPPSSLTWKCRHFGWKTGQENGPGRVRKSPILFWTMSKSPATRWLVAKKAAVSRSRCKVSTTAACRLPEWAWVWAAASLTRRVRYATERKAFGEPIANFQLIQAMLADSEAELYAAECMIADACARADKGEAILRKAAAAKLFSTETCGRVADRCVQIYGGAGYLAEYPAERFFRDARILRIYEGTSQIMQLADCQAFATRIRTRRCGLVRRA